MNTNSKKKTNQQDEDLVVWLLQDVDDRRRRLQGEGDVKVKFQPRILSEKAPPGALIILGA